jgi:hypothetical protein
MKGLAGFVQLLGWAGAIYVGGWLFLVGGIVNIIDAGKANPTNGGLIAWGLIQVLLLSWISWLAIRLASLALANVLYDSSSGGLRRSQQFRNW